MLLVDQSSPHVDEDALTKKDAGRGRSKVDIMNPGILMQHRLSTSKVEADTNNSLPLSPT